ncbi:hypothetical protein [Streptomyces sp. NPDC006285]
MAGRVVIAENYAAYVAEYGEPAVQGGGVGQLLGAGHDLRERGPHLGTAA